MPSETVLSAEEQKKKKSLEGQTAGMKPTPAPKATPSPLPISSVTAADRTKQTVEGRGRALAEEGVLAAEVQAKVQPVMDTPEKRADDWVKANGKTLGIGNRAAYFRKIKEGLAPAAAWKAVGGK